MTHDFLSELSWRGLLHQTTNEAGLREHLATGRRRGYVGFDPTADSLTIGNLVPIILLAHLQRAGHDPVVVMGGGTGLIGDPSGKSAERQLLSEEQVRHNVERQRRIFERVLDLSPGAGAVLCNNHDWLGKLGYIEVLRDVGKHFSVNMMIQRDAVRDRLHNREQGISYTEFSYILLQSYDFLHLRREAGVSLQLGGSDQWGNIASGCDLIRRVTPELPSFGVTTPLVQKADGGKFGKTESGAIWLTPERTSAYAFYQFWLNTADGDVVRFLKTFTFLPQDEIAALTEAHERDPATRGAQRALARHMTELLHGADGRDQAEAAAAALFSGEVAQLSAQTLDEVLAGAPQRAGLDRGRLAGEGLGIVDALVECTELVRSKREAREFLQSGSISVNGQKVDDKFRVTDACLLHGRTITFRRGKKNWFVTRWG